MVWLLVMFLILMVGLVLGWALSALSVFGWSKGQEAWKSRAYWGRVWLLYRAACLWFIVAQVVLQGIFYLIPMVANMSMEGRYAPGPMGGWMIPAGIVFLGLLVLTGFHYGVAGLIWLLRQFLSAEGRSGGTMSS